MKITRIDGSKLRPNLVKYKGSSRLASLRELDRNAPRDPQTRRTKCESTKARCALPSSCHFLSYVSPTRTYATFLIELCLLHTCVGLSNSSMCMRSFLPLLPESRRYVSACLVLDPWLRQKAAETGCRQFFTLPWFPVSLLLLCKAPTHAPRGANAAMNE